MAAGAVREPSVPHRDYSADLDGMRFGTIEPGKHATTGSLGSMVPWFAACLERHRRGFWSHPIERGHVLLAPQPFRGYARAFGHGSQLGPGHAGLHLVARAAVCTGDDPLAADPRGVVYESLGHQLRMLDPIGAVPDDAREQQLVFGQLDLLPHAPLVGVTRVRTFYRIGASPH